MVSVLSVMPILNSGFVKETQKRGYEGVILNHTFYSHVPKNANQAYHGPVEDFFSSC